MIQLNEALPERLYENADAIYYVLGGEGSVHDEWPRDAPRLERVCLGTPRHLAQLLEARQSAAGVALRAQRRALRTGALTSRGDFYRVRGRAPSASNAKPTKSAA